MSYPNRLGEIYVNFNDPDWVSTIRYTPEKVPPTENTPTSWQYSFVKARTVKNIPAEECQRWDQIAPLRDKLLRLEKQLTEQVRIYNENLAEFSKLSDRPYTELSVKGILDTSMAALMASPLSTAMPNLSTIEGIATLAGRIILPMFGEAIGKIVGMISGLFSNKKKKMEHFARQLEYRGNLIKNIQRGYMETAQQLRWLLEAVPNYKVMMQEAVATARNAQAVSVQAKEQIESRGYAVRDAEVAKIRQMNQNRVHSPSASNIL